jgi:hypothetical protein
MRTAVAQSICGGRGHLARILNRCVKHHLVTASHNECGLIRSYPVYILAALMASSTDKVPPSSQNSTTKQ